MLAKLASFGACVLASSFIAVVSGCGQSKHTTTTTAQPPAGPAAALEHRLSTHGYTVVDNTQKNRSEPYEQTFSVNDIDWTSRDAFDVNVYSFSSKAKAQAYSKRFTKTTGRFPQTNRPKLVGKTLFVGTPATLPEQCAVVMGSLHCPTPPPVPTGPFEKLISIAEGGH